MDYSLDAEALTALGHPGRLAVFRLLARRAPEGVRPSDIANDLSRVGALLSFLVNDCCRGRPELCEPIAAQTLAKLASRSQTRQTPIRVLFVCTGNSARSQFAEAILNDIGKGRFQAFSAGTLPAAAINPVAKAVLVAREYETGGLRPKPLDSFHDSKAQPMDFVFTLCDRAANEDCPALPGLPATAHWGIAPPSEQGGDAGQRRAAFVAAYEAIEWRLQRFVALPLESLSPLDLQSALDGLGSAGAKAPAAQRMAQR